MAKMKDTHSKCWLDCQTTELTYTASRSVSYYNYIGKLQKYQRKLHICITSGSTPRYISNRNPLVYKRVLHKNFHSHTIPNSIQNWKSSKCPSIFKLIHILWIHKYNRIWQCIILNSCNNVEESPKQNLEQSM